MAAEDRRLKAAILAGAVFAARSSRSAAARPLVMAVSSLRLANGRGMPILGLGTLQAKDSSVSDAVSVAIDAGYRHIDTAQVYGNEQVIGEAVEEKIKQGVVRREDLFIVTKLGGAAMAPADVRPMTELSLKKLRTYIDLYLIHSPIAISNEGLKDGVMYPKDENGIKLAVADPLDTWKEMEKLVDDGLVRAIGLSNFNISQIQRIWDNSRIKPSNLQVEIHAYFQQKELVEFCQSKGITVVAYAPLGSPNIAKSKVPTVSVMENPVIQQLAKKYGKEPAQVLLRNLIQRGIAVIPKSTNAERIRSNFKLWDFELTHEDMSAVAGLDINLRTFTVDVLGPKTKLHPFCPF